MTLRLSIVLATYNGVRHLPELLDSLTDQRLPPCELVASDDASDDSTVAVLDAFAANAPFPVRVLRSPDNLGVVENFSRSLTASDGDCIALADQDDIWRTDKLESLAAAFTTPNVVASFSDADVVGDDLLSLGYSMWQLVGFTPKRRTLMLSDHPWDVLFKDPVVTGATLMFRRELLPLVLPIPNGWMHDAWIAKIAASQGKLVPVDKPLVLYRQHDSNVIGGRKIPFTEQLRQANKLSRLGLVEREIARYKTLQERLLTFPVTHRRDVMLKIAEEKLGHLECRRNLPDTRLFRLPNVLGEWLNGNYGRYAKDWRNVAADLFML